MTFVNILTYFQNSVFINTGPCPLIDQASQNDTISLTTYTMHMWSWHIKYIYNIYNKPCGRQS